MNTGATTPCTKDCTEYRFLACCHFCSSPPFANSYERATHWPTLVSQAAVSSLNHLHELHGLLCLKISFNHSSTRSILAMMTSIRNPESTSRNPAQMHSPLICTEHTNVNEDNGATSICAKILNSRGVKEGNDRMHGAKNDTGGCWVKVRSCQYRPE